MRNRDPRSQKRYTIIVTVLLILVAIGKITSYKAPGADYYDPGYETQQSAEVGQSAEKPAENAAAESGAQNQETLTEEENSSAVPSQTEIAESTQAEPEVTVPDLKFRSKKLLQDHYEKHGVEMGFASAEEYEAAAAAVVVHPEVLHKLEAEDGDDVYYVESTNEFVIVSKDGYLRTYFNPSAGIKYYNKQ